GASVAGASVAGASGSAVFSTTGASVGSGVAFGAQAARIMTATITTRNIFYFCISFSFYYFYYDVWLVYYCRSSRVSLPCALLSKESQLPQPSSKLHQVLIG